MPPRTRSLARPRPQLLLEELESRTLLSASVVDPSTASAPVMTPQATVTVDPQAHGGSGVTNPTPPPGAYTPSQISQAYGFNGITFSNGTSTVAGNGAGQTIAIVDAYNDPNIYNDLKVFDNQYGLPNPNLTVMNQNGTVLGTLNSNGVVTTTGVKPPSSDATGGWQTETALDVEWAHAMAPGANIVLVEANSSSLNNLMTAVNTASNTKGVSVVSMSWGGSEFSSETQYDSYFKHTGVTYVASSGDSGAPPIYPAVSPNVIAVGGTTLNLSGSTPSETGWGNGSQSYYYGGSGGGISAYEKLPSYQPGTYSNGIATGTSTMRLSPDVAYDANPNTGFAIYDSAPYYPYYPWSYGAQSGWFQIGGTSAGAPQWAALVAIANQGRTLNGEAPLSGASQTLPALYNSSGDFHDITSGNNGYGAGPGYDLVTGLGSPKANLVVSSLVSYTGTASASSSISSGGSGSTSSGKVTHAAVLDTLADPPSNAPSSFTTTAIAATPAPATTATGISVLIVPSQTLAASGFAFDPSAVFGLAIGAYQTSASVVSNPSGQTSAAATLLPGWQIYAPGPQSISTQSSALSGSLRMPFQPESVDAVPLRGAASDDDLCGDDSLAPRQAMPISAAPDSGFERIPVVPAKDQGEEMLPCDACFLDEISLTLMGEQALALASGDTEGSFTFRVPELALFGLLAGSLWLTPDAAEDIRKRRRVSL